MEYIEFQMGDWSCDGHGESDIRIINSNLSIEEIKAAYEVAIEKLGFDFCGVACVNCDIWQRQKPSLTPQQTQKSLYSHSIPLVNALNENGVF